MLTWNPQRVYCKNSKTRTLITIFCPKLGTVWFDKALMHPKDADGVADSVDPDQTSPLRAV